MGVCKTLETALVVVARTCVALAAFPYLYAVNCSAVDTYYMQWHVLFYFAMSHIAAVITSM